jgi:hypothetical protein
MISARYATPAALLCAIALVPTVIHSYVGLRHVDGFSTASIPVQFGSVTGHPTKRTAAWVEENFEATDWFERIYTHRSGQVVLFVGRSYDAKRLYHHPELALLRGLGLEKGSATVARVPQRPDIPIHTIPVTKDGQSGFSVYALLHDGTFVETPILYQLRTAHRYLFRGREPMTLFMATDLRAAPEALENAASTRLLLAAIAAFEAQGPRKSAP